MFILVKVVGFSFVFLNERMINKLL